jgi:hypothetical protein
LCPRTFALFTLRTLLNAVIRCSQLNTQGVLGRLPASELLVIDAVGLWSMYFVIMPKVNLIVILMTYVRYLYSINCPTVICLPSMLLSIISILEQPTKLISLNMQACHITSYHLPATSARSSLVLGRPFQFTFCHRPPQQPVFSSCDQFLFYLPTEVSAFSFS